MKTKILAGLLALAVGFCAVSCDDEDDYSPATGKLVNGVTTGSSDVTATTATLNGTVDGNITTQSSAAYTVGFYYGTSESLGSTVTGTADGDRFSATVDGLTTNTTIYYQAFLTLQGTVTYKGEVKTLITTNAKIATGDASNINANDVTLAGSVTDGTSTATSGVVLSASSDVEKVRAGLIVASGEAGSFSLTQKGLVPGATYYYAAYLNLGSGVIYGDVKSFTTKESALDADEDFVDLGLSTKWCKFNIGASKASELGGLFAFGDLYGVSSSVNINDYEPATDIYKTDYDVVFKSAKVATIPTADEFQELFSLCKSEWTEQDGVAGYQFTGPNGNSIFLPAAGSRKGSTVSGEGEAGLYLTGSVNPTNSDFVITYEFANGSNDKSTEPRFMALSVRPVTVAKNVKFDKTLLYKKWHINLNLEDGGSSYVSALSGPLTYYGTVDSWSSVTNNEPLQEGTDSWSWGPDYSGNSWLGDLADYGTMEFFEDGTVTIQRGVKGEDGEYSLAVAETGTYTVDEENKTITLSIDILGFGNFNNLTLSAKENLKILSLTEEYAQIAILRDPTLSGEGACLLAYSYVTDEVIEAAKMIKPTLLAVGADWQGTWGTTFDGIKPADLDAGDSVTRTIKYSGAMNAAMVFTLDFPDLASKYPNAFVRIDEMKADGESVAFKAGKFYYGDIEGKGSYRVEFFNIYGCGTAKDSPFSDDASDSSPLESEPAFTATSSIEITYTIFPDVTVAGSYNVDLITINPSWGGTWGYNDGQAISVKYEGFKYSIDETTLSFSYSDAQTDYSAGSIMTFLQVGDIYAYFPSLHATLDKIAIDGVELTGWDASKVLDSNESPKYRLELWNCYGATKGNCAFGTADGDVIKELGFKDKMELTATFHSL